MWRKEKKVELLSGVGSGFERIVGLFGSIEG